MPSDTEDKGEAGLGFFGGRLRAATEEEPQNRYLGLKFISSICFQLVRDLLIFVYGF